MLLNLVWLQWCKLSTVIVIFGNHMCITWLVLRNLLVLYGQSDLLHKKVTRFHAILRKLMRHWSLDLSKLYVPLCCLISSSTSPEHTFSLAALSHPTQTQTKKEKIMNNKKTLCPCLCGSFDPAIYRTESGWALLRRSQCSINPFSDRSGDIWS